MTKIRKRFVVVLAAATAAIVVGLYLAWSYWNYPAVVLQFALERAVRAGDLTFSPDGLTLAVVALGHPTPRSYHQQGLGTRIYRVSDGKLSRILDGGSLRCAWSWDGSLLAVARDNWPEIEIWDARTWTLKDRLMLFDPARDPPEGWGKPPALDTLYDTATGRPKSEAPIGLVCVSLCFDHQGNLYVVEWSQYNEDDPQAFPYHFPEATVWWKAGKNRSEIKNVHAVSPGRRGNETRLACDEDEGAAISRVGKSENGPGAIRREYGLPQIRGGSPWFSLSVDGKYLVAKDRGKVCLFDLFDDHAKLLRSRDDQDSLPPIRSTDISLDRRFAAYISVVGSYRSPRFQLTVLRIPSAETVLQIYYQYGNFALSPDGRLVAAAHRNAIRIYRVPEGDQLRSKPVALNDKLAARQLANWTNCGEPMLSRLAIVT